MQSIAVRDYQTRNPFPVLSSRLGVMVHVGQLTMIDTRGRARVGVANIYDETLCRRGEYCLTASEMLFRSGELMMFQVQLAHRRDAVSLTQDYIASDRIALEMLVTSPVMLHLQSSTRRLPINVPSLAEKSIASASMIISTAGN